MRAIQANTEAQTLVAHGLVALLEVLKQDPDEQATARAHDDDEVPPAWLQPDA